MDTRDNLNLDATDLIERAVQAGRDQMAAALAELLANRSGDEADGYRDGVEDALLTLIQHGAADPRRRLVYCVRHNPPGTQPSAHGETHDCVDPHYV